MLNQRFKMCSSETSTLYTHRRLQFRLFCCPSQPAVPAVAQMLDAHLEVPSASVHTVCSPDLSRNMRSAALVLHMQPPVMGVPITVCRGGGGGGGGMRKRAGPGAEHTMR